ncbi:MAG: hypothetical protein M3Y87_35535 [Myxococcota bacterium]|nr:hypothetical protein [Myxococcota bacterium]
MVFFELGGLVLGAIAFALVWVADMALGPASGASPLLAAWAALVCLGGLLYDRVAREEGLRAYYLWVHSALSNDRRPSTSRVALLGVPLVAWPATMAAFALAFPLISGDELPPLWFFLVGLLTPAALAAQWARARARALGDDE